MAVIIFSSNRTQQQSTMNYLSLFLIFFYIHSIAGTPVPRSGQKPRMIGGDLAVEGQFPYMVSLQIYNQHFCGGGIIDDQFILTAAHCVIDKNGSFHTPRYVATMGTVDLKNSSLGTYHIPVETFYVPREFSLEDKDIAVLKLKDPIRLYNKIHIKKLELPTQVDKDGYLGLVANITGFGYDKVQLKYDSNGFPVSRNGTSDGKLRFAITDIISNFTCEKIIQSKVADSVICSHVRQRNRARLEGACHGDSGSPLVYNNTVIGVLSTGSHYCVEDYYPGMFTKVTSFLNFIKNAMNDKPNFSMRVADYQEGFGDIQGSYKERKIEPSIDQV